MYESVGSWTETEDLYVWKNNKDGKLSYSENLLSCVDMYKYLQMHTEFHMWLHVNTIKEKEMMWTTVKTIGLCNSRYCPSRLWWFCPDSVCKGEPNVD